MKLKETLKNHMGETVKIGAASSFFYCGTVDENIEKTIDTLSEITFVKLKRLIEMYNAELERFDRTWDAKLKNMERFVRETGKRKKWDCIKVAAQVKEGKATLQAEKIKARIVLNEHIADLAERIRTWSSLNERTVKEEYESIEGGTIIIVDGKDLGDYWTYDEYAGRTPKPETIQSFEGAQLLTAAIFKQACADIGKGRNGEDAEKFLRSDFAKLMCPRIDGEAVIKQVKKNKKDHGKWTAKDGDFDD